MSRLVREELTLRRELRRSLTGMASSVTQPATMGPVDFRPRIAPRLPVRGISCLTRISYKDILREQISSLSVNPNNVFDSPCSPRRTRKTFDHAEELYVDSRSDIFI